MRISDWSSDVCSSDLGVWAEHSVWPQDPGFSRALANGGVTTLEVLPGSANLFGGRSVVLKNVPGRTVQEMKFPGAPYGLKMACGENPKRVYCAKGRMPSTRMGHVALDRPAWAVAQNYSSEEHMSEPHSLIRILYAVFCLLPNHVIYTIFHHCTF